jgi:hypothetical protein
LNENHKINVLLSLIAFKVLEFLGQKKANGQIPKVTTPPKQRQIEPESRA